MKELWQEKEFERIRGVLELYPQVTAVELYGSVAESEHDVFSDLDITVKGLDPRKSGDAILGLFSKDEFLGQERYISRRTALYRILLMDGRRYDIKVLHGRQADESRKKVSLSGTDEFWFSLHQATHSSRRGDQLIALDLLLAGYREITQGYWTINEKRQQQVDELLSELDLRFEEEALLNSVKHVAKLASLVFVDEERCGAFVALLDRPLTEAAR